MNTTATAAQAATTLPATGDGLELPIFVLAVAGIFTISVIAAFFVRMYQNRRSE